MDTARMIPFGTSFESETDSIFVPYIGEPDCKFLITMLALQGSSKIGYRFDVDEESGSSIVQILYKDNCEKMRALLWEFQPVFEKLHERSKLSFWFSGNSDPKVFDA